MPLTTVLTSHQLRQLQPACPSPTIEDTVPCNLPQAHTHLLD